jgi:hypothetical protein
MLAFTVAMAGLVLALAVLGVSIYKFVGGGR